MFMIRFMKLVCVVTQQVLEVMAEWAEKGRVIEGFTWNTPDSATILGVVDRVSFSPGGQSSLETDMKTNYSANNGDELPSSL